MASLKRITKYLDGLSQTYIYKQSESYVVEAPVVKEGKCAFCEKVCRITFHHVMFESTKLPLCAECVKPETASSR